MHTTRTRSTASLRKLGRTLLYVGSCLLAGWTCAAGDAPRSDARVHTAANPDPWWKHADRKSTRLNSSHLVISYAVFCLKKKKTASTTYSTSPTTQLPRVSGARILSRHTSASMLL